MSSPVPKFGCGNTVIDVDDSSGDERLGAVFNPETTTPQCRKGRSAFDETDTPPKLDNPHRDLPDAKRVRPSSGSMRNDFGRDIGTLSGIDASTRASSVLFACIH